MIHPDALMLVPTPMGNRSGQRFVWHGSLARSKNSTILRLMAIDNTLKGLYLAIVHPKADPNRVIYKYL